MGHYCGLISYGCTYPQSVTTPPEPPPLLYTKSPGPKGHSSLLAIKDKEDVDRDETVDNAAAQALEVANKARTPAQAIAALQTGLTTEAARDRPPSQRMPRPAAAKSALKRPASSLQDVAPTQKAPKSSSSTRIAAQKKPARKKKAQSKSMQK